MHAAMPQHKHCQAQGARVAPTSWRLARNQTTVLSRTLTQAHCGTLPPESQTLPVP